MGFNQSGAKRGFHYDQATGSLGVFVDGKQVADFSQQAGNTYYVNNITGSSTNDGLTWGKAVDSVGGAIELAEAWRDTLTANNQYVRCAIVVQGTATDCDAVATADCSYNDFIGVGANVRGDGTGIARVSGANAADAWSFTATGRGNTWYNIQFDASGTSYCAFDCVTLLRCKFEECGFMGDAAKNESLVAGLRTTGSFAGNTIERCHIGTNWALPTSGISCSAGFDGNLILDNTIMAATNGIIYSGTPADWQNVIKGNVIRATTYGIRIANGGVGYNNTFIVGNWISSADAISRPADGGTLGGEHSTLGNWVNDAGTVVVAETAAG